jgi:hypothetical protein
MLMAASAGRPRLTKGRRRSSLMIVGADLEKAFYKLRK